MLLSSTIAFAFLSLPARYQESVSPGKNVGIWYCQRLGQNQSLLLLHKLFTVLFFFKFKCFIEKKNNKLQRTSQTKIINITIEWLATNIRRESNFKILRGGKGGEEGRSYEWIKIKIWNKYVHITKECERISATQYKCSNSENKS